MTDIPDTAPQPQDHKPKKSTAARKAEADGFVTLEVCGVTLQIPAGNQIPLKAVLRFKGLNDDLTPFDGDAEMEGTKTLLGEDQWKAFIGADPTTGDFVMIGDKLNELTGN